MTPSPLRPGTQAEKSLLVARSLYGDVPSRAVGMAVTAAGCAATAWRTGVPALWLVCASLVLLSIARGAAAFAFARRDRSGTLGGADSWKAGYIALGTLYVANVGLWSTVVFWFTDDAVSELMSISCGVGFLIGIQGRNFSSPALVRLQLIAAGVPIGLAFVVKNDPWYFACATFFALFLISVLRTSRRMGETFCEAVDAARRNHDLAFSDSLTGLPNRAAMQLALSEATRADRPAFALHFVDLDRFKRVNDTLGHASGDVLLTQAARRFAAALRPGDVLSRYAGDEFVILQRDASPDAVARTTARLIETAAEPFDLGSSLIQIGCSVGTALFPFDAADAERLTQRADTALYHAKNEGRGRAARFTVEMGRREAERIELESDLRQALKDGGLTLAFQPIVEARTARVVGFEALLRWHHETRGPVGPAEFIPVAEEAGLMDRLTDTTIAMACQVASQWPDPIGIAVNLSPSQLHRADLVATVEAALSLSGLLPSRLEFEITESLDIEFDRHVMGRLTALKALGCGLSLDDFGTGYSNLGRIATLPIHKVKIDRAFVPKDETDIRRLDLLRGAVHFISHLGYCVLVEGVETEYQLDLLTDLPDVSLMQGFLFGMALPAAAIPDFLRVHGVSPASEAADADMRVVRSHSS